MPTDSAEDPLLAAAEAWRRGDGHPAVNGPYSRWSVPGAYTTHGGALGIAPFDFAVWVAAGVGSGLLGNAAYDGLKLLIAKVRQRLRAETHSSAEPHVLSRDDVSYLVSLALRIVLSRDGATVPDSIEVIDIVRSDADGDTWQVEARSGDHQFSLTLTDRRPEDVLVFGRRVEIPL